METDEERAIRYRYRADEVQTLAAITGDDQTREALLTVAGHYESMARAIEDLMKIKRFLGH